MVVCAHGAGKATVAVARRILAVDFALLTQGTEYVEKDARAHDRKVRAMAHREPAPARAGRGSAGQAVADGGGSAHSGGGRSGMTLPLRSFTEVARRPRDESRIALAPVV
jgi:L-asparaginase II